VLEVRVDEPGRLVVRNARQLALQGIAAPGQEFQFAWAEELVLAEGPADRRDRVEGGQLDRG
jgi:hypothetical protein